MRGWTSAVVGLTIAVPALAGCGASVPPSSPPVAAAPVQADPCSLLTTAQLHTLGLGMGAQEPADNADSMVSCTWTNMPLSLNEPSVEYTARLVDVPAVGALPTGELVRPNDDQRTHCTYQVTLSPARFLVVGYGNIPGDLPGINHRVACQQAGAAATAMTSTYRATQQ